jgi:branched-chain amino acid transport system substrate-binding protein
MFFMRKIYPLACFLFVFNFLITVNHHSAAEPAPVLIGFDGEYGVKNSTSAQAIEKGLSIAIEEINQRGGVLGGRPLKLLTRDNRSVPARGIENIKLFAQEKDLVAVIGGRFSPVILSEIPIIHDQKIIMIDAWGSADGITSHNFEPSYTFRVSLRDRYAMPTMLRHAQSKKAKRIGILVPNTGWGRSNVHAAERYINETGAKIDTKVIWYNWGDRDFSETYKIFKSWNAEAVVMVANDLEGSRFVRYVASLQAMERLPIISHWGVTGGRFVDACEGALGKVDFSVVQTFSLFKSNPERVQNIMNMAKEMFGLTRIEDVPAPAGFGHAYDIVHILAVAINTAGTTDRAAVRDALEKNMSYQGLVRNYQNPFGPNDHEALELADVFMARYDEQGVIRPLETK